MLIETSVKPGLTQALGEFTQTAVERALSHQISITTTGATTTGVLAIKVRPALGALFLDVSDSSGTAITIDMVNPQPVLFSGNIDAIRVTPTSFNGTSYTLIHHGSGE